MLILKLGRYRCSHYRRCRRSSQPAVRPPGVPQARPEIRKLHHRLY